MAVNGVDFAFEWNDIFALWNVINVEVEIDPCFIRKFCHQYSFMNSTCPYVNYTYASASYNVHETHLHIYIKKLHIWNSLNIYYLSCVFKT